MPYLAAIDRDLGELMRRFAGTQMRMAATVGGNIANGSPIGDLPPALIALGATLGAAARRPPAHPAARELLPRLRQAGPPARRVRARRAHAEVRRGRAFPLLQDLQALRLRHFRRDGRVQAARSTARASRARASPLAAWRRSRSARAATEKALIENYLDRPKRLGRGDRGARRRTSRRSTICARARNIASTSARALLRRALTEIGGASTQQTRVVGFREAADVGCSLTAARRNCGCASCAARCGMTPSPSMSRAARPSSTTSASRRACCTSRSAARRSRPGSCSASISTRCAPRPASSRC